ncbi:FG-GAP repeat domain-containing protein [Streptomyces roseolus]|uniref:FG-GAP repeat domain-containing protein n=1 Tax=Streptomyces roseolus TaxID=67358 RepID=UPI0036654DAF
MTHPRSTARHRLGAVVAVVLMATAGPAVLPAAAVGTGPFPAAAPAATADATAPALKPGDSVSGVGRTGFLSRDAADPDVQRWTRLSDGAVTAFPAGHVVSGSLDSDVVVVQGQGTVTLRDMEAGRELFSLPLSSVQYAGAVGSTLFARTDLAGAGPLDLYSPGPDGPERRTATGLPADADGLSVVAAADGEAMVEYTTGTGTERTAHWAILDLASATVTSSHQFEEGAWTEKSDYALSADHVAWTQEWGGGSGVTVVVLDRATQKTRFNYLVEETGSLNIGLVGTWITFFEPGGFLSQRESSYFGLSAWNLAGTGAPRRVLDHAASDIDAAGDAHAFLGGTVDGGEGLYRVAPGPDGVPTATRLAATGEPTQVTLLRHTAPTTVDLDRTGGKLSIDWELSRTNVNMWITLRNTRTGESLTRYIDQPARDEEPQPMRFHWDGTLKWQGTEGSWTSASAGPYTWVISAAPLNGIGPTLKASGSFTVTRKSGAHDYDGDGSPDVLARDPSGNLWLQDVHHHPGWRDTTQNPESLVGGGWQVYDRIEATGNLTGGGAPEVVARDRDGVLWLYQGTGHGKAPFTARTRIGGGWNTYTLLTGGSDLTGDGRPDLVATDRSGRLWLYRSTGSASAPFAARRLIGSGGWQVYDQLTATGNIAGGPAGDLVARDKDGVLWLYLGKGDGTFAPRTKIGGGWQRYDALIGSGDLDRDGKPDLYATRQEYGTLSPGFYRGTGAWQTPFRAVEDVDYVQNGREFNLFA